jgi:hypothetical protein
VDSSLLVHDHCKYVQQMTPFFSFFFFLKHFWYPETGPFRATTSPHHMPLSTPTGRVACGLIGFDNRKPGLRLSRIAAGSTIKGHSYTLDQAITLGSIWAIGIAIVLPHIASNHPHNNP